MTNEVSIEERVILAQTNLTTSQNEALRLTDPNSRADALEEWNLLESYYKR